MLDLLLKELVSHGGLFGAILFMCYLYIRDLSAKLNDIQDKRVADQQAMIEKLLELNDKWNDTLNSSLESAEAQQELVKDLKSVLEQHRPYLSPRRK